MSKLIAGNEAYCPLCNKYSQLISVNRAARVASVTRRSVYRYIEEGIVHSVRVAGKTVRICASCLLDESSPLGSRRIGDADGDPNKV